MYGLVNAALRELIVSSFGDATWDEIRAAIAPDLVSFSIMESYPDVLTMQILKHACALTGTSQEDLLIRFGEHWVQYTEREGYGSLFEIAGDSLFDFLLNLNELHARVGRNFPKLQPPSFEFDVLDRDTLRMHYITSREGLCPFVRGLLQGLSVRFHTPLSVHTLACRATGADHCVFLLKLGDRHS